jgi:hypothetical protein
VATAATHEVGDEDRFVISMRNESPTQGFQLGVRARKDGLTTRWEFSGDLGATRNQLVSLIVTVDGRSVGVEAPNQATSSQSAVLDIRRGSALQPFIEDDVLVFNLNPALGGPGFIVAYIADAVRALNRIPPTAGAGCAVHELLVVDLGDTVTPGRQRPGDCNQDGRLNIADAICILQTLFSDVPVGGLPPGRFPCGDGAAGHPSNLNLLKFASGSERVAIVDAIGIINYFFLGGPPPQKGLSCLGIVGCPENSFCF